MEDEGFRDGFFEVRGAGQVQLGGGAEMGSVVGLGIWEWQGLGKCGIEIVSS